MKLQEYYIINDAYPASNAQMALLQWKISNESVYQLNNNGNMLYCAIRSGSQARFVVAARTADNIAYIYSSSGGLQPYTGTWTGADSIDCLVHGISTSETGFTSNQGYHPSSWNNPGWALWTGGTPVKSQ